MNDSNSTTPGPKPTNKRPRPAKAPKRKMTPKASGGGQPPSSPDENSPLMVHGRPAGEMTVSDILGQSVWLMTQSASHRTFFLSDLEWMVMPPILLRQFRIFPGKNQPIGLALWARVSDEVEQRLKDGNVRMAPKDWQSGPNYWLVELLAPFGHQEVMLADLQKTTFKGKVFKMHSVADGERRLITLAGEGAKLNTPPEAAPDEPEH
ncbi:MAG: toxin-activating lysine-acyltransferase [Rhizobiales bacterium]|nr:toxin-activating lysine-acyltransferase [Hyphomicrobiales bacterium]